MGQYIGPRCIPDVTGQLYDPTQSYENLVVVDNGMGTSYISRKPVPPGIPLTNTEYWGLFGATNGAIINLQNQIGDLTDLSTIDKDSLVNAINEVVTGIQAFKNLLTSHRIVCISDSYGLSRDGATPWVTPFQTIMGLSNDDYFAFAEGSMGFNQTGDGGHTALTLIQAHADDITDHDTITDFVILLGGNDVANTSGLKTAINNCLSYVKSEYPNAKIWLGFPYNQLTKNSAYIPLYHDTIAIYLEAAEDYSARWIDNLYYVMHNATLFNADGVHPNTTGGLEIARHVANFIINGSCDVKYYKSCSYNSTGEDLPSTIEMKIDNGICSVNGVFGMNGRTLNAGINDVKIGTITAPLFKGISKPVMIPLSTQLVSGTIIPAFIYIYEGDVYFYARVGSSDSIVDINLVPTSMGIPTLAM